MQDLKVNIGGPRDQAQQSILFHVRYAGIADGKLDAQAIQRALTEFRSEIAQTPLQSEDVRRVDRNMTTIEDEVKATKPSLKDIEGALRSIGKIVETVVSTAPKVAVAFRALAGMLGFSI